jgi:two-component system nitrogen regulation sensor histidine kinase NtrY
MMENSLIVADAYIREHAQSIRADADAMAIDVARAKPLFEQDRDRFRQFFTAQASLRDLPTAMMIAADQTVILQADIKLPAELQPPAVPPPETLSKAVDGMPQVGFLNEANYVGAVTKLRGYDDTYLYVARFIDPQVLAQIREAQTSIAQFANLEARRLGVQIAFALMYTVIALTVLLSAVWIGFAFANRLVADPSPDRCGRHRLDRQSPCPGAGAPVGGRSRPARRDLQQDDSGLRSATTSSAPAI